ncbi:MAG TPA: type II toxin-antitoxin system RelE/ParE family toxin [Polyangia bacterium]|nr:type II toxin-antitoxin system RelE/ParE family toxin [Polyangia bacterium]
MTGRRPVVWTEPAARDLERLAAYLRTEAPLRAERILERIVARGESLRATPDRGRTPPELRAIGERSWREILEPPWRLIYRLAARRIEIHAVLDGRRSLEDLLMERLLDG